MPDSNYRNWWDTPPPNKGDVISYKINQEELVLIHTLNHSTRQTVFEYCTKQHIDWNATGAIIADDKECPSGYLSIGYRENKFSENIREMVFRFPELDMLAEFSMHLDKMTTPDKDGIFPLRLIREEYI